MCGSHGHRVCQRHCLPARRDFRHIQDAVASKFGLGLGGYISILVGSHFMLSVAIDRSGVFSIITFNITSIAHNHHTDIYSQTCIFILVQRVKAMMSREGFSPALKSKSSAYMDSLWSKQRGATSEEIRTLFLPTCSGLYVRSLLSSPVLMSHVEKLFFVGAASPQFRAAFVGSLVLRHYVRAYVDYVDYVDRVVPWLSYLPSSGALESQSRSSSIVSYHTIRNITSIANQLYNNTIAGTGGHAIPRWGRSGQAIHHFQRTGSSTEGGYGRG